MLSLFTRTMQTTYEVAEVVKSIILSDKPNLRYQTNTKHKPEELEAKLADPTGNASLEIIKKTFLDAE